MVPPAFAPRSVPPRAARFGGRRVRHGTQPRTRVPLTGDSRRNLPERTVPLWRCRVLQISRTAGNAPFPRPRCSGTTSPGPAEALSPDAPSLCRRIGGFFLPDRTAPSRARLTHAGPNRANLPKKPFPPGTASHLRLYGILLCGSGCSIRRRRGIVKGQISRAVGAADSSSIPARIPARRTALSYRRGR